MVSPAEKTNNYLKYSGETEENLEKVFKEFPLFPGQHC
jgi:hypothetical protein